MHYREVYAEARRWYAWLAVLAADWVQDTTPAETQEAKRARQAMPALQPNCEQGSEDHKDEQARHQLEVYDGRLTCDVCRRYVSTTASAADKARFGRAP